MGESIGPSITIVPGGPYLVAGDVPLSLESIGIDDAGDAWTYVAGRTFEAAPSYALCRCGASSKKPYCDGTHASVAFDGTETASRAAHRDRSETIAGPTMILHDAKDLCAYARFCDGRGSIWKLVPQSDSDGVRETVAHEGTSCPSGRLVVDDLQTDGSALEPAYAPAVVLLEDPQKACSGPLAVRGGIPIASNGAAYETRNRVTLCRCGRSQNKPFCDGTHADVGFDDGMLAAPAAGIPTPA